MNLRSRLPLATALMTVGACAASASTVYGDLNNFDTVNDTGQVCRGFEIEIDGARSTDITYTYDWNHYGPPKITEDHSDPLIPDKVRIRYESQKNPDGSWVDTSRTDVPSQVLQPTDGHFCTDPTNYSYGCEHFGIGYYGNPAAIRYHWLLDDGTGNLVLGPAVNVGAPSFAYVPPAPAQPAQVVAVIPAPAAPNPDPAYAGKEFGEATWVKVIKTTTHNARDIALGDLVSADTDGDGNYDWQNGEPAEVETEWKLLQVNNLGNPGVKDELAGQADDMGDGSETVTRRYEFYNYVRYVSAAGASPGDPLVDSLDAETGEAMCSEIDPTTDPNDPGYLHGVASENNVAVTGYDPANPGETLTYYIDCSAQVMIGDYIGAQMAGFDAAAPLGLVDNLQDGDTTAPYTPRTVVVGGNSPYTITVTPVDGLPPGMTIGDYKDPDSGEIIPGVLSGTPNTPGLYEFTVDATDADQSVVSRSYTLRVLGPPPQQWTLNVGTIGAGTVTGSGIDCGSTCSVTLDDGSAVSLMATAAAGSVFSGWSGACSGTGSCDLTLNADTSVTARFDKQQYPLTVSKTGGGSGTVSGNGLDCGNVCTVNLDAGTAVNLTAAPAAGSVFTGWSGACSGTGACVTTLDQATTVVANFELSATSYSLTVTTTGSGTVTSSPKVKGSINCGKKCSGSFSAGTRVTLTASPKKNHRFLGWSGDCSGTSTTCTVDVFGNRNAGAQFN